YKELAGNDKLRVEATLGISQCLQSEGEYDKALEVIEALLKDPTKKNTRAAAAGAPGGTALPARPLGRRRKGRRGRPQGGQGTVPRALGARPGLA
ncbi:MAG TPA: hypothetical protein VKD72_23640, partial [Gemmataceae bacterium]|nr:hypothetical protein [Gemmataceae bacterium]